MKKFLTDEKPDLHREADTAFGFIPAVVLRHAPCALGRLVEVNKEGKVVNDWMVDDNAAVVREMKGRTIALPRDFPTAAKALKDKGAEVIVHPRLSSARRLAVYAVGDVAYL